MPLSIRIFGLIDLKEKSYGSVRRLSAYGIYLTLNEHLAYPWLWDRLYIESARMELSLFYYPISPVYAPLIFYAGFGTVGLTGAYREYVGSSWNPSRSEKSSFYLSGPPKFSGAFGMDLVLSSNAYPDLDIEEAVAPGRTALPKLLLQLLL